MAAQVSFLDRVLARFGSDATAARAGLQVGVQEVIRGLWPEAIRVAAELAPDTRIGDAVFAAIQSLPAHDDAQRSRKADATRLAVELGQLRSMLLAQSVSSISNPLLVVLVCWLVLRAPGLLCQPFDSGKELDRIAL